MATQLERRAALPPDAELKTRMGEALTGLPLKIGTVQPFFADVAAARESQPLTPRDVQAASFSAAPAPTLWVVPAVGATPAHRDALV